MMSIPLQPVPFQRAFVQLDGQNCTLEVRQYAYSGVYLSVWMDGAPVQTGVMCLDRVRVLTDEYIAFLGSFAFVDLQGKTNPDYAGFGRRYQLVYFQQSDDAAAIARALDPTTPVSLRA